jgi:hypothetical protein
MPQFAVSSKTHRTHRAIHQDHGYEGRTVPHQLGAGQVPFDGAPFDKLSIYDRIYDRVKKRQASPAYRKQAPNYGSGFEALVVRPFVVGRYLELGNLPTAGRFLAGYWIFSFSLRWALDAHRFHSRRERCRFDAQ